MLSSFYPPLLFGLAVDGLVFSWYYCISYFIRVLPDSGELRSILIGVTAVVLTTIYLFVSAVTRVKTWAFYQAFLPSFLLSCVSFNLSIDLWLQPPNVRWGLSKYFSGNDRIDHSEWADLMTFFSGIFIHFLYYIMLCRAWNRYSWRSLLIFTSTLMAAIFFVIMGLAMTTTVELLQQPIILILYLISPLVVTAPIIAMSTSRNFTFKPSTFPLTTAKILDIFTAVVLLMVSTALLTLKVQTARGDKTWPADTSPENDPMVLYRDQRLKTVIPFPIGVIQAWIYQYLLLPSLAFNYYSLLTNTKPLFLWELSIVQNAFILVYQYYYIAGALYWKTPGIYQIDPSNQLFWVINGFPVAIAGLNFFRLIPSRLKRKPSATTPTAAKAVSPTKSKGGKSGKPRSTKRKRK